ncbi:MAG TPA: hypothetical protein PLF81_16550 [Candidatus Anammoximicrobium sp.]|nr:hypothetical protein [Candidatus Anammoximicrobium sp.]
MRRQIFALSHERHWTDGAGGGATGDGFTVGGGAAFSGFLTPVPSPQPNEFRTMHRAKTLNIQPIYAILSDEETDPKYSVPKVRVFS